jgi:N-acetylglucosamine kinase-like BadF-type ATPase
MAAIVQETSEISWVLGIDVGGTGSRAALEPRSATFGTGRRLLDGPAVHVSPDGSDVLQVAAALIARVRREWPDVPLAGVGVGATGLASLVASPAMALGPVAAAVHASDPSGPNDSSGPAAVPLAVAIDAVTAHLGALGGAPGAVVAVGTGAIAIGTDLHEVWRRVGGWGHLYDDRGSGAWIGIEGLKAAILTHDGVTTDASALLSAAESRFGPAPTWPAQLYTRDDRGAILAGFAADVAGLASVGEASSTAIMSTAGRLVAGTLAAALDPALPRRAAGTGGVFAAGGAFTEAFGAEFGRLAPDAALVVAVGTPLDGAVHLARLAAGGDVPAGHPPFLWVP